MVRAREGVVGGFFARALDIIEVWFWGGLGLLKVKGEITRIGE